jgi:putative SOS response-associated peptidase YedK
VSFREAFARRRCLVPADGYYEWRDKAPFWIHPEDGRPVTFAGIWETRAQPGVPVRHTFAILTTAASEDLREVHDRMPLLVGQSHRELWLAARSPIDDVAALLRPPPAGLFAFHAVGPRVNRTDADDPSLIEPTEGRSEAG